MVATTISLEEVEQEFLKDPECRAAYDALAEDYERDRQRIRAATTCHICNADNEPNSQDENGNWGHMCANGNKWRPYPTLLCSLCKPSDYEMESCIGGENLV